MKPTTALLALALVAVLAYTLGSRSSGNVGHPDRAVAGQAGGSVKSAADDEGGRAAASGMGKPGFWQLVSDTRADADDDTGRQSELIEQRLREVPPDEIADYQRLRNRLDERAYTWELWGAAYVIEDGCSDDCFRDFRAYLISLGRDTYEAALRDPDSLAGTVQDAEEGDWENADSVAGEAYEAASGRELPVDDSDLSGEPSGTPWDDEDEDGLVARYPRLAEAFR